MEKREFLQYLHKEKPLAPKALKAMATVVADYPFFQAARALHLKGLKQNGSFSYNASLKRTAAYTTDRRILFEYITSKSFNQHSVSAVIKKRETPATPKESSKNYEEALNMKTEEAHQVLDPSLFKVSPKAKKEENRKSAEEKLQPGKPLDFDKSETHSFSEWMKLTRAKPIAREEQETNPAPEKVRKFELIDDFISKNPKISPVKESYKKSNHPQTAPSGNSLMTETLARVYLEQKNYAKAIQAYHILILKNPEKSGFFADQIRSIEKLQENKSS